MTLTGSGQLTTSEIYEEVYGTSHTTQEISLTAMAVEAGFSTSNCSTATFYGYTGVEPPGAPSSCTGVDSGPFATCTYGTATDADNYRVQYAEYPGESWTPSSDGGVYDLASPYTTTLGNGQWRFRVCGENAAGLGPYTTSTQFTMS